jgi:hypothetical protein
MKTQGDYRMKKLIFISLVLFLFLFPCVSASTVDYRRDPPHWGIILSQKYTLLNLSTNYTEFWIVDGNGTIVKRVKAPYIDTSLYYDVIGFGHRTIRVETDGNGTYYYFDKQNLIVDYNRTIQKSVHWDYYDYIQLFDSYNFRIILGRIMIPLHRLHVHGYDPCGSDFFPISWNMTVHVFIDDKLVWNDTAQWEHS